MGKYTAKELANMARQVIAGIENDDPRCEVLIMFIAAHCNIHPVEVGRRIKALADSDTEK